MSEFNVLETEFKDEECLIEALKEIGFDPEIHDEAVELSGYNGRGAVPKAHVVVRKKQFSGYGDAGFERLKEGGFRLHADDYDYNGRGKDKIRMSRIKQLYSAGVITKSVKKNSRYRMVSRKEQDGEIKIRVRRMGG